MDAEAVIAGLDWTDIEARLDQDGYAVLPRLLTPAQVRELAGRPKAPSPLIADLCASLYRRLAPVASRWAEALGSARRYPDMLDVQPDLTVLREGDYRALHQRAGAEAVFAFQLTALLSEPGREFAGGEFVMVEQRPRMQSRPMVVPLDKSDVAIIATAHRPHKGSKGYYRVTLKHAVSRVRSGERLALELVFH
jgi:hypothetical protein